MIVFAADHGITRAHKVGPYPRDVTAQMVLNFLNGGAAINTLSHLAGASFCVVDMGVDANFSQFNVSPSKTYQSHPIARGTQDISAGPAMTPEQLTKALNVGITLAQQCSKEKLDAVAIGEMGIGNQPLPAP